MRKKYKLLFIGIYLWINEMYFLLNETNNNHKTRNSQEFFPHETNTCITQFVFGENLGNIYAPISGTPFGE